MAQPFARLLPVLLLSLCLLPGLQAEPPPAAPADEPPAGTRIVHPGDGALMVYVPSGSFIMGIDKPEAEELAKLLNYKDYHIMGAEEWFPRRTEWLKGYFIDQHEVTNHQWLAFVAASGEKILERPAKQPPEKRAGEWAAFPVVSVYWHEARKYANYYNKQLPSEPQWEKAARGPDGRRFPWGDEPPTPEHGVFVNLENNQPTLFAPVGSKPKGASVYGCLDLAGNVYEWTSDWFEPYANNPEHLRLLGYTGHVNGVLRGGSFYHARFAYLGAKRFGFKPTETYYHVGFRTVWEPPAGYFSSPAFTAAKAAVPAADTALAERRAQAGTPKGSF